MRSLHLLFCLYQTVFSSSNNKNNNDDHLTALNTVDHIYGDSLPNSCVDKEDGDYWLLLSTSSQSYMPVYLTCSNGYVILDISKDSSLESYFSSYQKWHYALAGPSNDNPCTWEEWFLPQQSNINSHANYLISPSCDICEENADRQVFDTKTSYWMSGNLAKLTWQYVGYNDCDMDKDTYSCYNCESCRSNNDNDDDDDDENSAVVCEPTPMTELDTDWSVTGICGTAVQAANREIQYTRTLGMLHRTKPHYKPSLGTDGRFCVCYQPDEHDVKEYQLSEEQEEYLELKINEMNNKDDGVLSMVRVDGHEEAEEDEDLRESNIVYLSQKDFSQGTYRIRKSGTYIITENIEFDFNKDDDYWPTEDQNTEDLYPGAAQYRDSYFMGFFAGITVEADYVTIDLNGFELKQSLEFYYQQRWFAVIELGSQQFLPGQGPGFFGPDAINIAYCTIKGGILGLTSHFAIHGNFPSNFRLENVHIKDFVTHGMQLNGWKDLEIENVEIGPSSTVDYLKGDYGHARLMHFRLRDLEKDLQLDGTINKHTLSFDGRPARPQTVTDIAEELEGQMELALNYAMNKASNQYSNNNFISPNLIDFNKATTKELTRWSKAKQVFIQESGLPSSSSLTGIFLNFDGASVFTYTKYTNRQSKSGTINNLYIHDLKHEMFESMRVGAGSGSGTSRMYTSPWLSDFPAQHLFGSKEKLIEFRTATRKGDIDLSKFKYIGSAVTDAYIALGTFCDDWGYLGQELLYQTVESDSIAYWATGESEAQPTWAFGCNQDVMFHSGKGLLGLRIDGTNDLNINNLKIENLNEYTDIGSLACGEYIGSSRNVATGEGGHLKQQSPIQIGFSGNNLQAISIVSSSNIKFGGNIDISNINSNTGEGAGLSIWTATDITFDKDALVIIKNIETGKKLEKGIYTYDSLPNRSPEACAMRLETDDTSELYDSTIIFEHSNDNKNTGEMNVIACNVKGHESCLGDEINGHTLYGTYLSDDESACNQIKTVSDLESMLSNLKLQKDQKTEMNNNNNNENNQNIDNSDVVNSLRDVRQVKPEELNPPAIVNNIENKDMDDKVVLKSHGKMDQKTKERPNILMIMLDDLGRADISSFGAEWDTPYIDEFIESSISLSHHYIGYVCSASRSQFLTGRHSFHNGYGTLDVFDRAKLGGIPQGTPTIADYLKNYGGYRTYIIGKWQLGYSFNEQTPNYRGFDYFWGFYGGLEDYFDKTAAIRAEKTDPHRVRKDDTEYYDFWENMEPDYDAAGTYSTYQFLTKVTNIIDSHNENDIDDYTNEEPFFIYLALQAPHMPFPDQDTEFGTKCDEIYDKYYNEMEDRDGVCEGMLGVDYLMQSLIDYFNQDKLKDLYDNTLIVFTSDNGGALSHGSCNYPLRGGKNTYFDGNQRVHTFVGGGYIPDSERGTVRSGLFSNVDWLPTLMSFAGVVPHNYYAFSWNNELIGSTDVPFTFDGYNQYEYIMNSDSSPLRDHIMFQLRPILDDNSNYVESESSKLAKITKLEDANEELIDNLNLEEIALVFYDNNGNLWKYFDAFESTNEIGNVEANCNWCTKAKYNINSDNEDEVYTYTEMSSSVNQGLFDLSSDQSESFNLYDTLDDNDLTELLTIISKNAIQYFNNEYSESSVYLYGNFDCFYTKYNEEAWPKFLDGLWKPFIDSDEFATKLLDACGFDEDHVMYKLHTNTAEFADIDLDKLLIDKSDLVATRNSLANTNAVHKEIKRQEKIFFRDSGAESKEKTSFLTMISIGAVVITILLIGIIMLVRYFYCDNKTGYNQII